MLSYSLTLVADRLMREGMERGKNYSALAKADKESSTLLGVNNNWTSLCLTIEFQKIHCGISNSVFDVNLLE